MIKLLVGALLALSAFNVIAGNMYIYKDKENQVLLTNVNPSGRNNNIISVKTTYFHSDNYAPIQNDSSRNGRDLAIKLLKNMQENRRKGIHVANESEITKMVGQGIDDGLDLGAKVGMTKKQVLNQTHWGLETPDYVHQVNDKYGELEQWYYHDNGALYFDKGKLSSIQILRHP